MAFWTHRPAQLEGEVAGAAAHIECRTALAEARQHDAHSRQRWCRPAVMRSFTVERDGYAVEHCFAWFGRDAARSRHGRAALTAVPAHSPRQPCGRRVGRVAAYVRVTTHGTKRLSVVKNRKDHADYPFIVMKATPTFCRLAFLISQFVSE